MSKHAMGHMTQPLHPESNCPDEDGTGDTLHARGYLRVSSALHTPFNRQSCMRCDPWSGVAQRHLAPHSTPPTEGPPSPDPQLPRSFLENMLRSRISRRTLAEQHMYLNQGRPGYVGVICTNMSVAEGVDFAGQRCRQVGAVFVWFLAFF